MTTLSKALPCSARGAAGSSEKKLLFATAVLVVAVSVILIVRNSRQSESELPQPERAAEGLSEKPVSSGPVRQVFVPHVVSEEKPKDEGQYDAVAPVIEIPLQTNREPQAIIADLETIGASSNRVTAAEALQFKSGLLTLVQQGKAAVPAISEELQKNIDNSYSEDNGGDQLSYSSLRASLLDTLHQIGGPDAQAAMVQTLQSTAVPAEILDIAKDLEQQSPGTYREMIVAAAQEALKMGNSKQLGDNAELGPLYRALNQYGNAGLHGVSDAPQAGQ